MPGTRMVRLMLEMSPCTEGTVTAPCCWFLGCLLQQVSRHQGSLRLRFPMEKFSSLLRAKELRYGVVSALPRGSAVSMGTASYQRSLCGSGGLALAAWEGGGRTSSAP